MSKYLEYFEGAFDSTVADKLKPENKPYVAYSKTEGVVYTIIPKEEKDMWIVSTVELKDISNCTYNMVDLGLPSGLKWADRNVGASSPEHYGSYFQWGDTNAYTYDGAEITTEQLVNILNPLIGPGITVDNVKDVLASQGATGNDLRDVMKAAGLDAVSMNKEFNWDSYFDTTDGGSTFNKYNYNGGLTVLESIDDAATVHMGSRYRMPTIDEMEELIYDTTQTFIDLDGNEYDKQYVYDNKPIESGKLKGVRFTGSNGNSIFIPAAGRCYNSLLSTVGDEGILWSSILNGGRGQYVEYLSFGYEGDISNGSTPRRTGVSVRGVDNSTKKYLTFKSEEDNSSIGLAKLSTNQILEYSTDTATWNNFDTTTNISLNNGDKVYVRGILSADIIDSNYTQFKMSGKIAAHGNCNAIWNYKDLEAPLKAYCGVGMFFGCTSLTVAPELPAMTLTHSCYSYMFSGCTSLTIAPELPAMELAEQCYLSMFYGCTSLTTAPELPATVLAEGCYRSMFNECTSLTTAPVLSATVLAEDCYNNMFYGCTSLNYIECLATDISATGCTYNWVKEVANTGTFVKHPSATWSTGNSSIPSGWTVVDAVL